MSGERFDEVAYMRRYMRRYRSSHGEWGKEALRRKYALAREAGYSSREASKRAHWVDPLADRPAA